MSPWHTRYPHYLLLVTVPIPTGRFAGVAGLFLVGGFGTDRRQLGILWALLPHVPILLPSVLCFLGLWRLTLFFFRLLAFICLSFPLPSLIVPLGFLLFLLLLASQKQQGRQRDAHTCIPGCSQRRAGRLPLSGHPSPRRRARSPPQPPPKDTYPASRPTGPTPRARRSCLTTRPPGGHARGRPGRVPRGTGLARLELLRRDGASSSPRRSTPCREVEARPPARGRSGTSGPEPASAGFRTLPGTLRRRRLPSGAASLSIGLSGSDSAPLPARIRVASGIVARRPPRRNRAVTGMDPTPETGADPGELPPPHSQWEAAPRPDYKSRRAPGSPLGLNYKSQRAPRAPRPRGRRRDGVARLPGGGVLWRPSVTVHVKHLYEGRERRRE